MINVIPSYRPHRVRRFVRGLTLGTAAVALDAAASAAS